MHRKWWVHRKGQLPVFGAAKVRTAVRAAVGAALGEAAGAAEAPERSRVLLGGGVVTAGVAGPADESSVGPGFGGCGAQGGVVRQTGDRLYHTMYE